MKLPWVPILDLDLRKGFTKKDIKSVFTSGAKMDFSCCVKISRNIYLIISPAFTQ